MRTSAMRSLIAVVAAAASVLAGCGGGSGGYTEESIKTGFVEPADLGGKDVIAFEDDGSAGHIVYTPEDSVPTCPYAQRADDAPAGTTAAVQLQGGNATGRFIVGPVNPARKPRPSSPRAPWSSKAPSSPTPA